MVGVLLAAVASWEVSVLGGWDAAALTILLAVRPIVIRSSRTQTRHLALRDDETQGTARLLVLSAS